MKKISTFHDQKCQWFNLFCSYLKLYLSNNEKDIGITFGSSFKSVSE